MIEPRTKALLNELIQRRKDKGLTQHDVARRMHVGQQAVSKIESSTREPFLSTLERYARAVDSTLRIRVEWR